MKPLNLDDLEAFVNENIVEFHRSKIRSLERQELDTLLKRKNPYLFRAKNLLLAQDLILSILDAHISSSEEELFGQFLEQLAIFVAGKTVNGVKSSRQGIDLEYENHGVYSLVQIKSSTNWGNSAQQNRLEQDFNTALDEVRQEFRGKINVRTILGSCYGRSRTTLWRGEHLKISGQNFWYLLSDNEHLYTEIIEPIGYRAKEHNEEFLDQKARIVHQLTQQLLDNYCDDWAINWERIVKLNSGNFDLPDFLPLDET